MAPEQVEAFAIKCAKGNNGGEWLKKADGTQHYTDKQKDFWRQFVRDIAQATADADTARQGLYDALMYFVGCAERGQEISEEDLRRGRSALAAAREAS